MSCKSCKGKGEILIQGNYAMHLISCKSCAKPNNKAWRSGKRR